MAVLDEKARRAAFHKKQQRHEAQAKLRQRLLRHRQWMIVRDGGVGVILLQNILWWTYVFFAHKAIPFADASGAGAMICLSVLPFFAYGKRFRKATRLFAYELIAL